MEKKTVIKFAFIFATLLICSFSAIISGYLLLRNDDKNNSSGTGTNDESQEDQVDDTNFIDANKLGNKKLIFIHHSTGENWLADYDGGLGAALDEEGFFVSDTNYGWGPDSIGDATDIGQFWDWFQGSNSATYMTSLFEETSQNSEYTRTSSDPGGENEIIMFKSCFPNSNLLGDESDVVPAISANPLKGQTSDSEYHTISNAKGIYIDLLEYFKTNPDKLFIVITAPPLGQNNTTLKAADNARALNNWLKNDWIDDYEQDNVAVFDFYNVLTDDGASNFSLYSTDEWNDHPNSEGNQKATQEFVAFLNTTYNSWIKD